MKKMDTISLIANILLVIGGLNWGLVAFGYNLVEMIFGSIPMIGQIIYILVGLSALYVAYDMFLK